MGGWRRRRLRHGVATLDGSSTSRPHAGGSFPRHPGRRCRSPVGGRSAARACDTANGKGLGLAVCATVMVNRMRTMSLVGMTGGLFLVIGACNSDAALTNGDAGRSGDAAPTDGDASQTPSASYAICSTGATTIYRVDPEAMTCTFVVLTPSAASCPSGVMISDRCFMSAGISSDVAVCDALQIPATALIANSVSGTFTTHVEDPAGPGGIAIELAEFDLTLTFPANSAHFPASQHLVGTRCLVACSRPTSYCGP
jgi:hypothetical protein